MGYYTQFRLQVFSAENYEEPTDFVTTALAEALSIKTKLPQLGLDNIHLVEVKLAP